MPIKLFILSMLSFAVFAGGRVGNGFVVPCHDDQNTGIKEGYYSLDYLATLGEGELREVDDFQDDSESILGPLLQRVLTLDQVRTFEEFVNLVKNQSYQYRRVWKPSPSGVINVSEDSSSLPIEPNLDSFEVTQKNPTQNKLDLKHMVKKLPPSCIEDNGFVNLIPAIVFQDGELSGRPKDDINYSFNPEILKILENQESQLQLSFLYRHEWLWDISDHVGTIATVNHFLHSKRILSMDPNEIKAELKGMGFPSTTIVNLPPLFAAPSTVTSQPSVSIEEFNSTRKSKRSGTKP